jgi:hypothetical protein
MSICLGRCVGWCSVLYWGQACWRQDEAALELQFEDETVRSLLEKLVELNQAAERSETGSANEINVKMYIDARGGRERA